MAACAAKGGLQIQQATKSPAGLAGRAFEFGSLELTHFDTNLQNRQKKSWIPLS
jgi:hypothetical protein